MEVLKKGFELLLPVPKVTVYTLHDDTQKPKLFTDMEKDKKKFTQAMFDPKLFYLKK